MQHKHRQLFDYICANITGTIILRIFSDSWCNQLHFGMSYNIVARILSEDSLPKRGCKNCRRNIHSSRNILCLVLGTSFNRLH
jgi:hypothetical protein